MKQFILALLSLSIFIPSFSQDKKEEKWDVSTPILPYKEVSISTEEPG